MDVDGTYSSMPLNSPEHTSNVPWPDPICSCMFSSLPLFLLSLLNGSWSGRFVLQVDVDLVEECMWMIGGLQSLAHTQSSQYVLNEASWVCNCHALKASIKICTWQLPHAYKISTLQVCKAFLATKIYPKKLNQINPKYLNNFFMK